MRRPSPPQPLSTQTAGSVDPGLRPQFWRLTVFNALSTLTIPLTGLVDTAMLGHLDEIRFLAGVALAGLIFDYVYWSVGFLRMGTTGTTAQAWGAGNSGQVYRTLYRSLMLAGALGVAFLVLQWPLRELGFALLSGESGVEAAGREYFDARVWGAPAALLNMAFVGWFLGRAESGRALIISASANLANIFFNWIFIVKLGMAARGAGIATVLSQYLMLGLALGFFFAAGKAHAWRWRQILDRSRFRSLMALNRDILIRSLLLSTAIAVFTNSSSILGTTMLAANTVLMRLFFVASYLTDGIAFATESLAGIYRGRGDQPSFLAMVRLAMVAGVVVSGVFLIALWLARAPALHLLTSHQEVIDTATLLLPWMAPVLLFGALAFVYDGIFLGLTAGRELRNSMLFSALVVYLPLVGLALLQESAHLLWLALAAFMAARAASLAWISRRTFADIRPTVEA